MAAVAVADVDVVDVGVGLQGENEPNQVGSRQQHRDSVHQGPGSKVCLQINTQVTNTWMLENKKKRILTQYGWESNVGHLHSVKQQKKTN